LQAVWAKLGRKRLLWERMSALCDDYTLESMRQLLAALVCGTTSVVVVWVVGVRCGSSYRR
jgi:hypothetical protein